MMKQRTHRLTLTAVGLLILLAFALRAHHLDHFSFWIDEALTPLRASQSAIDIIAGRTFIQEAVSYDTHPPLYYLIVYTTRQLWGESDYAYRYVSLLSGVLLVPLLFQLGRELFQTRRAGLLVALFGAINPLFIWYSQEARMYTLLVWLGALTTYLLLRALNLPPKAPSLWRWFALYLLAAGLTLYTHYTAVFLIATQALVWAWLLWRDGYHKLILVGVGLAIVAAIPLIPLTVPRLFTGAEAGYTYLSPLVMLNDVVGGFSMGVTAPEPAWVRDWLWGGYLLLLGWGAWATARQFDHGRVKLFILLSYLLATVVGLALGSLLKPMYQGVRHIMLGSPAFLLLITAGLVSFPEGGKRLKPLLRAAGILLVLAGSLGAVWNLYTNPAVAKDDLRGVVAHIEREAAPGDAIVYNDVILMLAHWHYATREDVTLTAVPIYPHAIRPATPHILAELAAQHPRFWFIPSLPTDGRDDDGFVRAWLADNLHRIDSHSFTAKSTELKVETYRVANTAVSPDERPYPVRPLQLSFDQLPPLIGFAPGTQTESHLWFDLFWQGETPPTADQRLIFTLLGPDGWEWVRHSERIWPATEPWPTGESVTRTSYRLRLPPGLPAGAYTLHAQGWDDGRGVALGEVQPLMPVEVSGQTWDELPRTGLTFGDDALHLLAVTLADTAVKPGHNLPISLLWAGGETETSTTYHYDVELVAPDGTAVDSFRSRPGANWLAMWPPRALVGEFLALQPPSDAVPGTYQLRWRVTTEGDEQVVRARPWWQPPFMAQEWATFGTIMVEPWPFLAEADAPTPTHAVQAQFGDFATLLGYDLNHTADQLHLTLHWRAEQPTPASYFVFVHLVDPATGQPIRQRDWLPVDGVRPTQGWRTGEILLDPHTLDLTDLPPGQYQLNVGFYLPDSFERPPITQNGQSIPNGQLTLERISHE